MKKINKRGKALFLFVFAIIMVPGLLGCGSNPKFIASSAVVEAGSFFEAQNFLTEQGHSIEFDTDFAEQYVKDGKAQIHHVGKYTVGLIADGKKYDVKLTVNDTVAPVGKAKEIFACQGAEVDPEQCVTAVTDATDVKYSFKTKPDTSKAGISQAVVALTDEGGNESLVTVNIEVISIDEIMSRGFDIEAGSGIPDINKLINFGKDKKFTTDVSVINTDLVASYDVTVEIDGKAYETKINIVDTVAPTATVTPQDAYLGAAFPEASSFVSNIVDAGPVKISFETEPSEVSADNTAVKIVLTDQASNKTVYDSFCNIKEDHEAPVFIEAPATLDVDMGAAIIWRALVSAEDNSGRVDIDLDTTAVNLKKAGTYTAQFVASDKAGNKVMREVKVVVHDSSVTLEMMNKVCDKIFAQVIKDGMTKEEKVIALAQYVHDYIKYNDTCEKDDLRKDAYLGLTTRKYGNCYTYYSACVELFSRLGIETMMVCRNEESVQLNDSHHVWVYVNMGDKDNPKWYHCDASKKPRLFERNTFLLTTAQTKAYTKWREAEEKPVPKWGFMTFDQELYPESATEILVDLNINQKYYE